MTDSNDMVIGEHEMNVGNGKQDVLLRDLFPEPRRWLEIGRSVEMSVHEGDTQRAVEFYNALLHGTRTFNEELDFIHSELRRWHAAGLSSAEQRIAELEHEREIANGLQPPPPEPEVMTGSTTDAATLDELAEQQGVKPVHDLSVLNIGESPLDDTADTTAAQPQGWRVDGATFERVCAAVHNGWWEQSKKTGRHAPNECPMRPARSGKFAKHCSSCHPDMYPYEELSENVKEYDRVTVRAVLSALNADVVVKGCEK